MKRILSRDKRDARRSEDLPRCSHRWVFRGTETLHAGTKPRGQVPYPEKAMGIVELRKISQCEHCGEYRVKISRELVYGRKGSPMFD